ncbi:G patch domain-containing protein 4 [Agrilus planipennis]|uniref:G patch domain-containing protein 4 n=1 Tax=Agrilus planipennis TaxID=224129 RepID=A0A1W4X9L1_AGRPL|nr:G patch domain-containing protein 4 [Agrilus planipennis]
MDFAKKQLEKYGWREGQGLGKNETGISKAIKPKLKFDTSGVGHNSADEFKNDWWNNIYNRAASNIDVSVNSDNNVQLKLTSKESIDISTKGYMKGLKCQNINLEYGSFIKRSTLTDKGLVSEAGSYNLDEPNKVNVRALTDEELLAACEGRTAHKGARHGIKQSGKLSRIEKQEKMLLKKLKKISLTDNDDTGSRKNLEKKLKKINDQKDKNRIDDSVSTNSVESTYKEKNYLVSSPAKLNKSRKKQRKRVSFNETVTEYQTQEVDSSPQSGTSDGSPLCSTSTIAVTVKLQAENDPTRSDKLNDQDEGIDCPELDLKNSDSNSNSDEFDVSVYKELSKKERKILRRKLKKQNERNTKTAMFLDGVIDKMSDVDVDGEIQEVNGRCQKCSKRKLKFEVDDLDEADVKKSHYENKDVNRYKEKRLRKQRRLEKRLNKVVHSLHSCKISDSE